MEYRSKKVSIILISLLFHLFVLVLLLIFYSSPEHEWTYFDTTPTSINTPETIFSEPSQQFPEPQHAQEEEAWAELKPRASTFGNSVDPSRHIEDVPQVENENSEIENEKSSRDALSEDSPLQESPGDDSRDNKSQIQSEILEITEKINTSDSPFVVSDRNAIVSNQQDQSKSSQKSQKASAKKQAQKALASITRGYLEQLAHEGENLIKTIGGDPNKMPSAEQLKYERYLAKIQWCLQNAHNINRDKCQMHEPIQTTMRVYFTLSRGGKMGDLKIIQSSGDSFVDRYIKSLFETASSSFPPVPAYIKEDPYPLLYTVMVCWNVNNPSSFMGLMRE